jgi:hypothetical protein
MLPVSRSIPPPHLIRIDSISEAPPMSIVKNIRPGSAFKMGLVIYGILGLIIGVFASLASMIGMAFPGAPSRGMFFGAFAVVFLPIVYGVFGGIVTAISALVYNFAAGGLVAWKSI